MTQKILIIITLWCMISCYIRNDTKTSTPRLTELQPIDSLWIVHPIGCAAKDIYSIQDISELLVITFLDCPSVYFYKLDDSLSLVKELDLSQSGLDSVGLLFLALGEWKKNLVALDYRYNKLVFIDVQTLTVKGTMLLSELDNYNLNYASLHMTKRINIQDDYLILPVVNGDNFSQAAFYNNTFTSILIDLNLGAVVDSIFSYPQSYIMSDLSPQAAVGNFDYSDKSYLYKNFSLDSTIIRYSKKLDVYDTIVMKDPDVGLPYAYKGSLKNGFELLHIYDINGSYPLLYTLDEGSCYLRVVQKLNETWQDSINIGSFKIERELWNNTEYSVIAHSTITGLYEIYYWGAASDIYPFSYFYHNERLYVQSNDVEDFKSIFVGYICPEI